MIPLMHPEPLQRQFPVDVLLNNQTSKIQALTLRKEALEYAIEHPIFLQTIRKTNENQTFPRSLSIEASTKKMKKNLFKASCEHWNLENKINKKMVDVFLTLDIALLEKMGQIKETLENQPEIINQGIQEITSDVFLRVLSSSAFSLNDLGATCTSSSLYKEWSNKQLLPQHSYAYPKELMSLEKSIRPPRVLGLQKTEYLSRAPGRRSEKSSHFALIIPEGVLLGIFDEHKGNSVAQYASAQFQSKFSTTLSITNGNVHQTFEFLFDRIEKEISEKPEWASEGTSAIVTFIDKNNYVFTATLGGYSEANIYRKLDDRLASIPLSILRNWTCPKEARRAATALGVPSIEQSWPLVDQPRTLRFYEIDTSRTLGNLDVKTATRTSGIIHKPKITMCSLLHNDFLVLASGSLKKNIPEAKILQTLSSLQTINNPAKSLGDLALSNMESPNDDDVTVIAIRAIKPK